MIGIVDYGMGNLLSVYNACEYLGYNVQICKNPDDIKSVERIILPGVGAFNDCMKNLNHNSFVDILNDQVLKKKKPFLGICLGLQALAKHSSEGGKFEGLGWLDAEVIKLTPNDPSLKIPQVGWNEIAYDKSDPLFKGLKENPDVYFVHSYYMKCNDESNVIATCDYGCTVTAAVHKNNIFATQFHPEKSQDYGLQVLKNFLEWEH